MSMTAENHSLQADDLDGEFDYRPLSSIAVASLVLGLLSALALLDWFLLAFPVVGIVLGIYAVKVVGQRLDEYSGHTLAKAGLGLSAFYFLTGFGWLSYSYATEVPDGYSRISYADLQPGPDDPANYVPPSALALNGKRVFLKGYIYPGKQMEGIQNFLLCRDRGDCCFGGDPKITDRVLVQLEEPLRLTYKPNLQRVAGTFRIEPGNAVDAGGMVLYRLEADYLK